MGIMIPRSSNQPPIQETEIEATIAQLKAQAPIFTLNPKFEAVLCLPENTARFAVWSGFIASDSTFYSRENSTRRVDAQLRGNNIFQHLYDKTLPKLIAENVSTIITDTRIPSTARFFQKNGGIVQALEPNITKAQVDSALAKGGHTKLPFTLNIKTAIPDIKSALNH